MHASIPSSLTAQLAKARLIIEHHLGDTVVAIHLFGSALHGGLKPSSDIDLFVIITEPPTTATRRKLMADLLSASAPSGTSSMLRPLEVTVMTHECAVPWTHPARREMQFGEWLRSDIEAGVFEEPIVDPDLTILVRKLREHGVSIVGPDPCSVFEPIPDADISRALRATIAQWKTPDDWLGDERNIVLALARIWFTAETDEIVSKEQAADWLITKLEDQQYRDVVRMALKAYRGDAEDDWTREAETVATFIGHARHAIARILEQRRTH